MLLFALLVLIGAIATEIGMLLREVYDALCDAVTEMRRAPNRRGGGR